MKKKQKREIFVGKVKIGGDAPISVQSMTNTDTRDVSSTVKQIHQLEKIDCEIVRVAVPDMKAAKSLASIKQAISIPLIADIHFDYKLALEAIKQGIDGLRINPGNIGSKQKVKMVVAAARERKLPIRVGVNAGSLEKRLLQHYTHPTPEAMVESAMDHLRLLEDFKFFDIKVSLKSSNLLDTIQAYRLIHEKVDYPLHLGITAAGPLFSGSIRSSIGLGILLAEGIGDTIRVSLTGSPLEEVKVGYEILKALNLRERGAEIISCPTCGRCEINIIKMVDTIEKRLSTLPRQLKIAVMGCVVNGPGEAKEADIGIAGGKGVGVLFKKGKIIRKLKEKDLAKALIEEAKSM
ncbi:MAG: flavodoxin-dependent (E)-4-hydroxy-3-methylbut-2-enyl-diphosphate synthase [Deltaproteobacteria bacterium]|jgi:(E)-4-hydroxy-3-methylbut-2-enyl-diphosphate synthase|nr:flavodoxin-dependent (E)-4-hydroxy-3-methylbut-2-enyl-diphosphate synthase [Deltaproteobacteria bacterium]